jgi:hypothetical protein
MIAAVDVILSRCDDATRVIPGHGPLARRADVETYRRMLATVHERVAPMIRDGQSRDEVIAARPTADLDETWGSGFLPPDVWVGIVYDGYVRNAD